MAARGAVRTFYLESELLLVAFDAHRAPPWEADGIMVRKVGMLECCYEQRAAVAAVAVLK